MILPSFLYIPPGADNEALILHTKEPFYLGQIVKSAPLDEFAILNFKNENKPLVCSEIVGYSILISFAGQLKGNFLKVNSPDWEKDLQNLFGKMAYWFLTEKINKNLNYYKKYKIL
jgi:hypothetical protein